MLLRCCLILSAPYMEELVMALNHHWCVGVDLHKDTLTACVFCGCCGEVSFQKIACKCRRQIAEYFAALPRPHTVAIESVGFYRWLWEMLEPIVEELVLADATQARALAGRRLKTDREDALNIAAAAWPPGDCPRATLRRWRCSCCGTSRATATASRGSTPASCTA